MLKLSEAMRLGAMMGPQAFRVFQEGDATCAMGAARKAAGLSTFSVLPEDWEWLRRTKCWHHPAEVTGRLVPVPCEAGTIRDLAAKESHEKEA